MSVYDPKKYSVIRIPAGSAGFKQDTLFAVANMHLQKVSGQDHVHMMQGPYIDEDPATIKDFLRSSGAKLPSEWVPVACDVVWPNTETAEDAEKKINFLVSQSFNQNITAPSSNVTGKAVQNKFASAPVMLPENTATTSSRTVLSSVHQKLNSVPVMVAKKAPTCSLPVPTSAPIAKENQDPPVMTMPLLTLDASKINVTDDSMTEVGVLDSLQSGSLNHANAEILINPNVIQCSASDQSSLITQSPVVAVLFDQMFKYFEKLSGDVASLKTYCTERFASLESKMLVVEKDVHQMTIYLKENRKLAKNDDIMTEAEFKQAHNIHFPFETQDQFTNFENLIGPAAVVEKVVSPGKVEKKVVNTQVFEDLKKYFISTTNSEHEIKTACDIIFKAMFTGDVLRAITAQRASRQDASKLILKNTRFFVCLKDAFTHVYANKKCIGDGKVILDSIGTIINKGHGWASNKPANLPPQKSIKGPSDGSKTGTDENNVCDSNKNKRRSSEAGDSPTKRRSTETGDRQDVLREQHVNVVNEKLD